MLEPVTKRMTDESGGGKYLFTFYCDICGSPWHSTPYNSANGTEALAREMEFEHASAYERANREAMMNLNRCPVCKRMVCDKCFLVLEERDLCKECEAERGAG